MVEFLTPQNGNSIYINEPMVIKVEVQNATQTQLLIGAYNQIITHSSNRQYISFSPYTFTEEDIGETTIIAISSDNNHKTTPVSIQISVERNPRSEFLIAIDPGHFIGHGGHSITGSRRTPQMPDLMRDGNGNLVPDWSSVSSILNPRTDIVSLAPSVIPTPDGDVNIFTANGIVTPIGYNVSTSRKNPAFGVIPGGQETERIQMREWEFNNAVAKYLIELLETKGYSVLNVAPEHDPRMTGAYPQPGRDTSNLDNGISNTNRVNCANNSGELGRGRELNTFGRKADYYLSIHANAGGPANVFTGGQNNVDANGIETFYQSERLSASDNLPERPSNSVFRNAALSKKYADAVHEELLANGYGQYDRTVKRHWLRLNTLFDVEMPATLIESGFFTNFADAILLMDEAYRKRTAECLLNAIDRIYENWREGRER
jgi:N-acetylmuramoyl-L-alanine amidase